VKCKWEVIMQASLVNNIYKMKPIKINKLLIILITYFLKKYLISRNMKIKWWIKKIMPFQIIFRINNKTVVLTINNKINLKIWENYNLCHHNNYYNHSNQWINYSLQQLLLLLNLDCWLTFNKVEKLQINFSEIWIILFIYLIIEKKNNLIIFFFIFCLIWLLKYKILLSLI